MSVNYTPHKVDVPVTDLDDDADDILFSQHVGLDMDDLDFDPADLAKPPLLARIKAFFSRRYEPLESFELRDMGSFDISSQASTPEPGFSKPSRVSFSIKNVLLIIGSCVILVLVVLKFKPAITTEAYVHTRKTLSNSTTEFYPTTLIISLDGFHPHYISPKVTPTLHDMMMNEFGAPYMVPSFPSSTFPNHWTLVTGLYPADHGIVGNTFYDPKLKKQFVNTDPKKGGLDPDFWRGGEPIWTTARKQGVKTAVHMWPGSEVPGIGLDTGLLDVDRFNGSELLSSKVSRVMGWLDRSDIQQRPELILTYVPTIDSYGHKYGISGPELKDALSYVDDFIALIKSELHARNLDDIVNLIVVSDHGMAPTSNDRLLYLDDIIDMHKIEHIDGWPLFGLRPYKEHSVDSILSELQDNFNKLDPDIKNNFNIYRTEDLPQEWNFGGNISDHTFNYRLAPLWVVPKVGYSVTTHQQMKDLNQDYKPKGVHGYNNTELLMRALFLGSGPYFRSRLEGDNKRVKPFLNTNIYNVLCETLNLNPAPNNGTQKDGYIQSVVSTANALPQDWQDRLAYPGLWYEVEHLVEDATYDLLWKPKDGDKMSTVVYGTNNHAAESLSSEEASMTQVTSVDLPKPSDFSSTHTQTTTTQKGGLHKIFDSIEDQLEDIEDSVGDIIEDVQDSVEGLLDKILGGD